MQADPIMSVGATAMSHEIAGAAHPLHLTLFEPNGHRLAQFHQGATLPMFKTNPFRNPEGQPLVYGHRGARGVLPENTMAGFDYLRDIGLPGVEIDVQLTSDGVPVVIHDPRVPMQLARDARGNWLPEPGPKIIHLTVEELLRYDVGCLHPHHPYSARYPDQRAVDGARVPLLAGFLDWAEQSPDMMLNIEIKSFADQEDLGAAPDALAGALVDALAGRGLAQRCLLSSFDWRVLRVLRDIAPNIARGYLTEEQPGPDCTIFDGSAWMDGLRLADHGNSLPRLIADQCAQCWCAFYRDVTHKRVAAAHELGLAVNVWTVNDTDDIQAMVAMGVDGVITDYPERALECLAREDTAR